MSDSPQWELFQTRVDDGPELASLNRVVFIASGAAGWTGGLMGRAGAVSTDLRSRTAKVQRPQDRGGKVMNRLLVADQMDCFS